MRSSYNAGGAARVGETNHLLPAARADKTLTSRAGVFFLLSTKIVSTCRLWRQIIVFLCSFFLLSPFHLGGHEFYRCD